MRSSSGVMAALVAVCMVGAAGVATAAVQTKTVRYTVGGEAFEGYLAWDDAARGARPAVLVVHEWWGLNDYAKVRARQLAAMGYVAFAADMYGGGKTTSDPKEAGAWAGQVRGTPKLRERVTAAFEAMKKQPGVDAARTAAIGFCFGGTAVLELAYGGADVDGVVSFHGGLTPPGKGDRNIRASILALHGAEDPHVPPDAVKAWEQGLDAAGADWQLIAYAGAVHTFTNPAAGRDAASGSAYQEKAARRSWAHMQTFFTELFQPEAWDRLSPDPAATLAPAAKPASR